MRQNSFSRRRPPTLAASYSGPGRRDEDEHPFGGSTHSSGSPWTLTRRHALMIFLVLN